MDPLSVLFGISIGVIAGAIWVLLTIRRWHRIAQENNHGWAEFCKKQNEEWLAVSLNAIGRATSSSAATDRSES
jgi:gas vesicle protein